LNWIVASFGLCLLGFTAVGLASARQRSSTSEDYLVAGRSVSPWLAALSAVATNNSGFMFIGLIGFTYRFGVQAVWLQAGWLLGDLVAWLVVHRKVREVSGRLSLASVPAFLGRRLDGTQVRATTLVAGLLTLFFLGGYAAAQLKAGSTALHVLFGWDMRVCAVLGAVIVVLYCFSGGLRASIWTDAAQSMVMIASMAILIAAAALEAGGLSALLAALGAIDPSLARWIPGNLAFGFGLYFLGFVVAGFGAIGQPHILIRMMAIRDSGEIARARNIYFLWFVPFSIAAVGTGLYARVLLPDLLASTDPAALVGIAESALPRLSMALLPDVLVGVMLAGVFAATMSTADSQILSCSAALTQDIAPRFSQSYVAAKSATLAVTVFALVVALFAGQGVFDLVLIAWSALGASLGPLVLLRVFGRVPSGPVAVAMMTTGVATIAFWGASPWSGAVFKLLPGMLVPLAIYASATALEGRGWMGGNLAGLDSER
jgi:sodium/proline symporter